MSLRPRKGKYLTSDQQHTYFDGNNGRLVKPSELHLPWVQGLSTDPLSKGG